MCRQLTIIAESLPVRNVLFTVDVGPKPKRQSLGDMLFGKASLTKERNPVSNKSGHLTEQAEKKKEVRKALRKS